VTALWSLRHPPVGSMAVRMPSPGRRFLVVVVASLALVLIPVSVSAQTSSSTLARVIPQSLRIRAFGDGVIAGFGVAISGTLVPISNATDCRPVWIGDGSATSAGTRCSSNGRNGPGSPPDEVSFSADFGRTNGASWAAQVSQTLGAVDYANYAVSGSSLASWLNLPHDDAAPAEGAQHNLLERIEQDDPDIVLASLGGEALLQQPVGAVHSCTRWSDESAQRSQFVECVNRLLAAQLVKQRLMAISFDLLAHTINAKLLFSHYSPASPRLSALLPWQQVVLADAINAQIDAAVVGVRESGASWAERIDVVALSSFASGCVWKTIAGPSLLGRNWWTSGPCMGGGKASTPISMGTVPGSAAQTAIAAAAVSVIRNRSWS